MPSIETQFSLSQEETSHHTDIIPEIMIPDISVHPSLVPLPLFHWIPRSKAISASDSSIDSIISHKVHLVNIRNPVTGGQHEQEHNDNNNNNVLYPIVEMRQNGAQEPQIIVGDQELQIGKAYYWEMRVTIQGSEEIENSDDSLANNEEIFGDLIELGILNMRRNQWDKENLSDQKFGWCLFADGVKGHDDEETPEYLKDPLQSGDLVGVLCNLKYDSPGVLSFFVNGVSCGIAYSNVTGPVRAAVSLVQPGVQVELVRFEERQ
mmetsp:Transcript_1201/g.4133  ORF Transcript_1201/g.4133 Transcript_1201/m.4133 type:complete len:264 (-) Transcript_1201:1157-1948(-)